MGRWTTGEVSKLRNISVRTLRYYDQINLLTPSFREDNGKRYYSEGDLFQLEKILLLKSLSLSLEDIQAVLDEYSYKQILISHYNYLQEQQSKLQTSISNTASLINMIHLKEDLSWEHVSELVQNAESNSKKWIDYFQEDEQAFLQENLPSMSNNDYITQQYISLLQQVEKCIESNISAESEEGLAIGAKLLKISEESFRGDVALMEKFWEVRKQPVDQTGLYPISEDALLFVERSIAKLLSRENGLLYKAEISMPQSSHLAEQEYEIKDL